MDKETLLPRSKSFSLLHIYWSIAPPRLSHLQGIFQPKTRKNKSEVNTMRETSWESCCTSSTRKLFIHLFIHSFIHSFTHSVAWSCYSLEQAVRTIFIFISVSIFYFHVDFYFDLYFATFSLSRSHSLSHSALLFLFPCLSLSYLLFSFLFLLLLTLQLAMKTSLHWKCCARHFLSVRQGEIADERREEEREEGGREVASVRLS